MNEPRDVCHDEIVIAMLKADPDFVSTTTFLDGLSVIFGQLQ